jgi:hypothetical protein
VTKQVIKNQKTIILTNMDCESMKTCSFPISLSWQILIQGSGHVEGKRKTSFYPFSLSKKLGANHPALSKVGILTTITTATTTTTTTNNNNNQICNYDSIHHSFIINKTEKFKILT